jgi:ribonucleoside-diphosphate reductase alpha chain
MTARHGGRPSRPRHLDTQVALQPFVDNSISKTINVPKACPFDEFSRIYDLAYDLQLKGCTTFRPNPITGTVLSEQDAGAEALTAACWNGRQTEIK